MTRVPVGADTSLARGDRAFPSTCWSRVLESARAGTTEQRASFEAVASSYWKPVYAYVRTRWAKTNEDAKDLTQDFFAWMLESGFVERADPARGRFRAFVKVALEHFLADDARKQRRLKRGGGLALRALDAEEAEELRRSLATEREPEPGAVLDQAWRRDLLARAVDALEERYTAEGRPTYFQVFRDYFLDASEELDYAAVAARYGIGRVDVSNYLQHAKRRYRATLRDLVAETVTDADALREELDWLLGG